MIHVTVTHLLVTMCQFSLCFFCTLFLAVWLPSQSGIILIAKFIGKHEMLISFMSLVKVQNLVSKVYPNKER